MTPEQLSEWQSLKRSESVSQAHADQWWREFEQHKNALETLIFSMTEKDSVLRCALMLMCLQLSINMLGRQLDEIELRA